MINNIVSRELILCYLLLSLGFLWRCGNLVDPQVHSAKKFLIEYQDSHLFNLPSTFNSLTSTEAIYKDGVQLVDSTFIPNSLKNGGKAHEISSDSTLLGKTEFIVQYKVVSFQKESITIDISILKKKTNIDSYKSFMNLGKTTINYYDEDDLILKLKKSLLLATFKCCYHQS